MAYQHHVSPLWGSLLVRKTWEFGISRSPHLCRPAGSNSEKEVAEKSLTPGYPACLAMTQCAAVYGRLRCANRPYVVWGRPAISRLAGLVMMCSQHFPPDFTFSSQKPIFPSQIPPIFCPLINGPACHRGGEGQVERGARR